MINLMYLVLTAMLALNVSAEILNAFITLDRGLQESSDIAQLSNDQLLLAIGQQADAYSQFEPFREKSNEVVSLARSLEQYLTDIRDTLIAAAGGPDAHGVPVHKKNKEIATRLLVDGGLGDELKAKILSARELLLATVEDPAERAALAASIPLRINEPPADSKERDWSTFTFRQMPVVSVLPLLTKWQNDVHMAQTVLLNHFLKKTEVNTIKPDAFIPVVSAEKSYIIRGEPFRSEVFLAAYSSTADNIKMWVDGRALEVRNGKAEFNTSPGSIGLKKHEMKVELTDPVSGEVQSFSKSFSYEVGERSVAVSAEKMNVLYVGVDNPLAISAAGVPSGQIQVRAEGTELKNVGNGKYVARPAEPGSARIIVSAPGLEPTAFPYRVRRIPDPVPTIGGTLRRGDVQAGTFRAQQGVIPILENFDFEATCNVLSYEIARVPSRGDTQVVENQGARFEAPARRLVDQADHGDTYYVDRIKVKCPGDRSSRELGGLIFRIK
jgi:gliding motility-associated protein GldM